MESKELSRNVRQVLKSHDFLIWAYLPRRAIKQTPPRPLMVAASAVSSQDMFSEWIFVRLTHEDKAFPQWQQLHAKQLILPVVVRPNRLAEHTHWV